MLSNEEENKEKLAFFVKNREFYVRGMKKQAKRLNKWIHSQQNELVMHTNALTKLMSEPCDLTPINHTNATTELRILIDSTQQYIKSLQLKLEKVKKDIETVLDTPPDFH